jgi:hypothetical protein
LPLLFRKRKSWGLLLNGNGFIDFKAQYISLETLYIQSKVCCRNVLSSLGGFFNAQFTLPDSWSISTEVNYRAITGFSAEYNRSETLWNIDISKNFLKNKAATVTLLFNDILQQQLSFNQIISSNFVEDQQFNTLKSFVMLVFSYKFNTMGGTSKQEQKEKKTNKSEKNRLTQ